jgi:hypothetical protein
MRLNADGDMRVSVVAKRDPPKVQIRAGPLRFTAPEAEAVDLATQLATPSPNYARGACTGTPQRSTATPQRRRTNHD